MAAIASLRGSSWDRRHDDDDDEEVDRRSRGDGNGEGRGRRGGGFFDHDSGRSGIVVAAPMTTPPAVSAYPTTEDPGGLVRFDLIRLLRFMEREAAAEASIGGGGEDGNNNNNNNNSNNSNNSNNDDVEGARDRRQRRHQVNHWRIDHLENLWRQLRHEDKSTELRRRIDRVMAGLVVLDDDDVPPRLRGKSEAPDRSEDDDDDPVRRIFFPRTAGGTEDEGRNQNGGPSKPQRPPQRGPEIGADNGGGGIGWDDPLDPPALGGRRPRASHEEGATEAPTAAPSAGRVGADDVSSSHRRRSVQELREDQRHQMEEAIATMASQLKRQTEAIHTTLRRQNENLGGMEDVAERNVDHVQQLAKDVTEHVRKGWTTTLTTWALLLLVAISFVVTCLVILMVPKRPGACLLFCPRPTTTGSREAAGLICRDNPVDGTRECLTIDEALARLYEARPNDPPPQLAHGAKATSQQDESARVPSRSNGILYDDEAQEEWGGGGGGGGRADETSGAGAGDRECGWDGAGADGGGGTISSECASEGAAAAGASIDGDPAKVATDTRWAAEGVTTEPQKVPVDEESRGGFDSSHGASGDVDSHASSTEDHDRLSDSPLADGKAEEEPPGTRLKAPHADESGHIIEEEFEDRKGDFEDHASDPDRMDEPLLEPDELAASVEDMQDDDKGDDEWDLPPIPDANDVLREYMENYRQAESEFLDADDAPLDDVADGDAGFDTEIPIAEGHEIEGGTVDVPIESTEPFTPFDVRNAAAVGDVTRLERYLSARPEWVNDADRNSWTCLHLAARAGHEEVVQVLLRHGADRSLPTVTGDTPFHIASKRLGPDHPVSLLLDVGVYV